MTTNQERAAEVIYPWIDGNYGDQDHSAKAAAQALADAGLLTPDPQPRTLADLLEAGHDPEEYQWMQATYLDSHYDQPGDHVISNTAGNYVRLLRRSDGMSFEVRDRSRVIPSQDLPRMVWPDEHHPTTDTEETPEPDQPRPEDVPAGERDMEEQTVVVDRGWIYHGDTERTHLPDGTTVLRFVTDWEEA